MATKKNYDSEFCGSLPLNHINVIQDYGYLIVLDHPNFTIIQCSENVTELFDSALSAIVGVPLEQLTYSGQLAELKERFKNNPGAKIPLTFSVGDKRLQAIAHFKGQLTILEIEKAELATERSFSRVYEEIKYAIAAVESAQTVESVSAAAVRELKKLTGFDGIMMYRFDEDWNGTVIAQEKTAPELEDYMGHTFPASDIPKQARDLYLKNPYRLIPDRQYPAIKLFPVLNPLTHAFTDLSDCNLRGVAAVHLEYLKNMNVNASMSIRVIHNGQLWGLIACHHVQPHYLNFELCAICEMLSSVISNRISAILQKEDFEAVSVLQHQLTALVAQVYEKEDLLSGLMDDENNNLLQLFKASGVVAVYRGRYQALGEVPDRDMIENMLLWLQHKSAGKMFMTDELPALFDEAMEFAAIASGALAIPVTADNGDFIICFRPEVVQTINWGGDPGTAISFDPDGTKYHPRASFKIWQQTVHNTALSWSAQEIAAAERLKGFIYEYNSKEI